MPLEYFSWRATFVCLALARPRPIGSTPSVRRARPAVMAETVLTAPTRAGTPQDNPGRASASGQPEPAQSADLGHPPLGQPVGRDRRRHALVLGQPEDPQRGVEDLCGLRPGPRSGVALDLVGD